MTHSEHPALLFLKGAGIHFPDAWKKFADFRANKGKKGLPMWADWCYCPMAAAYAVVSGGGDNRVAIENMDMVASMAAVAAWRMTKGIYRFDPTVRESLITTPLTGDLPIDVLFRLPEWCVYIETESMTYAGLNVKGFFVHLEDDVKIKRPELRFVMLTDDEKMSVVPVVIHLHRATLHECLQAAEAAMNMNIITQGIFDKSIPKNAYADATAPMIAPFLNLVLYLCSQNAEVNNAKNPTAKPENPKPTKNRHGEREFAAQEVRTWDVAIRMGAALRKAEASGMTEKEPSGEHSSPRPHIRRAHWHTYLTGTGRSERTLKWLPPIAVNIDDENTDFPATIHPIP